MKTGEYRNCEVCGKEIYVWPSRLKFGHGRFCSRVCMFEARRGPGNPYWNGGIRQGGHGYLMGLAPDHPAVDQKGYVLMHRLVMEKSLGRYLKPEEVVHHINEKVSDNRLENLRLFSSNSEHMKYHREERKGG